LRRNGRADHGELRSRTDPDHAGGPRRGNDQNSGGAGDPGGQSAHGRSHLEGRRRGPDQLRRTVGLGIGPDPDDSLPADLIPAAASLVSDARSGSDGAWIGAGGQARASIDDPQPSQDLAKIDGPPDPDALGRKQAVVLRIPHALVPVSPIPTDWDSCPGLLRPSLLRPSPLRIVARLLLWMSHNGAPKTAMSLITLPVSVACMISSCVLQASPCEQLMLRSPLARRRKARHTMLPSQRALFDIPREICYLNAASWSPLPIVTQEAGRAGVARKGQPWLIDPVLPAAQYER